MRRSARSEAALQRQIAEAQERSERIQSRARAREEAEIRKTLAGCTARITTGLGSVVVTFASPAVPPTRRTS